jgi:hypothetical protein
MTIVITTLNACLDVVRETFVLTFFNATTSVRLTSNAVRQPSVAVKGTALTRWCAMEAKGLEIIAIIVLNA